MRVAKPFSPLLQFGEENEYIVQDISHSIAPLVKAKMWDALEVNVHALLRNCHKVTKNANRLDMHPIVIT